MARHAIAALLGTAVIIVLSACGSNSDSPRSMDDLRSTIEKAGYTCQEPVTDDKKRIELDCGEDIYAIWYPSAADEVQAFDALESVYDKVPVDLQVIRGDDWRVSGEEGAVTKVAESLKMSISTIGN